jgi:cytoskeletal protein CcmA (bactofilin family)
VVKGRVEGDVSAPSLQVSASGAVHGKVKVGEMQSHGELSGEFDAETVQLSGSVKDNTIVRARSLEVKLAPTNGKLQVVFGECTLDVGEAPSKEAAINPPKNQSEKTAVAKANGASVPPPAAEAGHRNGSVPPPGRMEDPGNKDAMQALGAESLSDVAEPGRKPKR